jgi:hypothetical protein
MRKFFVTAAVSAFALITAFAAPAMSNGLVDLHTLGKVNGKTCMIEHWHSGRSGAWRSKSKAQSVAIRSWKSLVRLEYGNAWANYATSIHKRAKCVSAPDGQTSCTVMSRPCRY